MTGRADIERPAGAGAAGIHEEDSMSINTRIRDAVAAEPIASSLDEEAWLDARAEGVSASEVSHLSQSTRERILDDKLNGSTFRGNKHTNRGHERESLILGDVVWQTGRVVEGNSHVWALELNARHLATPDGFALDGDRVAGVEVKSHAYGFKVPATHGGIPQDHYDQMQWGMHVTGLDEWLYAWEVMAEDGGEPTDEPVVLTVERDQARIDELVERADEFLAWVDAGAPVETLSDELAELKANLIAADVEAKAAAARQKTARAAFEKQLAEESPAAMRTGWKHADDGGTVTLARPARKRVIDIDAWRDGAPATVAAVEDWRKQIEQAEAVALEQFGTVQIAKPALRIAGPKGAGK